MRVLVTGAYGLIGSACLARLHRDGHEVTGAGRDVRVASLRAPFAKWITADFRHLTLAGDWLPLGTLVRLPRLKQMTCPADPAAPCQRHRPIFLPAG